MKEKKFSNKHYEYFYTKHFGFEKEFYTNKTILDIGCGPRGSLNWATNAQRKIGLDPLAYKYIELGSDTSKMDYVTAYSEKIPFEDNSFDIICSFNPLDHVESIEQSLKEIKRALKPNGLFLLIIDIHPYKTITEPHAISWKISATVEKKLKLIKNTSFKAKKV